MTKNELYAENMSISHLSPYFLLFCTAARSYFDATANISNCTEYTCKVIRAQSLIHKYQLSFFIKYGSHFNKIYYSVWVPLWATLHFDCQL